MVLPVTLVLAAACGLINVWLAIRCAQRRVGAKIMIGDNGDAVMQARARAHANFVEYAPFVLVLAALIELARGASPWLWALGAVFVLARLAHPLGMDRAAPHPLRAGGALVTWVVLALLAEWALAIAAADRDAVPLGESVEVVPSA